MKKSFLFLTTLFLVIPSFVFADSSSYQQTIELDLNRTPKYEIAVTSSELDSKDKTIITIPDDKKVDSVLFTYDSSHVLQPTTKGSYYISYVFTEYKKCSISGYLSGDLILEGKTESTASDSEKVPFTVEVTSSDSSTSVVLDSETKNNETLFVVSTEAEKLGDRMRGSLELTIKPVENKESVNGKSLGKYTATMYLTVTENS